MTTVAIVDDSMIIRVQLKKFFEKTMAFEVIAQGADGDEAIRIFKENAPDLMTIDLTMPNKGGVEAIKEIIGFNPQARIIVVTAIREATRINEALHLGAKGFVNKPLQLESETFIKSFKDEIEYALGE